MYVCVCKGITESELIELASRHVATSSAQAESTLELASATLGVGTGCGRCLEFAGCLLENQPELEATNAG